MPISPHRSTRDSRKEYARCACGRRAAPLVQPFRCPLGLHYGASEHPSRGSGRVFVRARSSRKVHLIARFTTVDWPTLPQAPNHEFTHSQDAIGLIPHEG